jgi:tyrosine-protein phosphatase SIW14
MPNVARWVLAVAAVLLALGPPYAYHRYTYTHAKRFREVVPGRLYRAGQPTASGLREIIDRYGIKTVINLQHEEPDPLLPDHWMGRGKIRESALCAELGVKYLLITPDILPSNNRLDSVPPAVEEFLKVMDDESNYPVLLHCRAGLHRTGRLTAVYRMEYMGWSAGEAMRELRANGYGFYMASEADNYIIQYVQNYRRRELRAKPVPVAPPRPVAPGGRM